MVDKKEIELQSCFKKHLWTDVKNNHLNSTQRLATYKSQSQKQYWFLQEDGTALERSPPTLRF